eukprot:99399_1
MNIRMLFQNQRARASFLFAASYNTARHEYAIIFPANAALQAIRIHKGGDHFCSQFNLTRVGFRCRSQAMFDTVSSFYGLSHQGRCLAAQLGETERHCFLVGSRSVRGANEVTLLEFDEDSQEIIRRGAFTHAAEVESLSARPSEASDFFSCYASFGGGASGSLRATLWRMPSEDDLETEDDGELEEILSLSGEKGSGVKRVIWETSEIDSTDESIVSLTDENFSLWRLDRGSSSVEDPLWTSPTLSGVTAGCWDPHHPNRFVSVNDSDLQWWDFRAKEQSGHVPNAHSQRVLDVDYNPNKPYHVVTGGEDRRIRFWDLRAASRPLKVLSGHSHWVCQAKYNRFHDQLVLSAGTDSTVKLWAIISISSAPLGELEDYNGEVDSDRLIGTLTDHEESVYAVEWSCCDAWIYASLSYDGRVGINHVPSNEKYKILL